MFRVTTRIRRRWQKRRCKMEKRAANRRRNTEIPGRSPCSHVMLEIKTVNMFSVFSDRCRQRPGPKLRRGEERCSIYLIILTSQSNTTNTFIAEKQDQQYNVYK